MRVAIIAEGAEDQVVIQNILRAFKIDSSDILFVKPSLQTDASSPDDATIGTFQGVKKACMGINDYRYYFEMAFLFFEADFVIIHLDTAEIERQDFLFQKPTKQKNENYSQELRKLVIDLINSWLDNKYTDKLLYAIAIEEIEAWCLTIIEKKDSVSSANAKEKLKHLLKGERLDFNKISQDFRKIKNLAKCLPYNQSLKDFVESVKTKLEKLEKKED